MAEITQSWRRWWVLGAMAGCLGLVLLDETAVGVALPTIRTAFDLSVVQSHWVVNAYLLVFASLVAVGGKLGDVIGLKRLTIFGVLLFGAASIGCGLAADGTWLIVARLVQGIGAAVIFPASITLVALSFSPHERGMAVGLYGAIGTAFLGAGPYVGGVLTDALSWRWIFWVNAPLVLVVALIVLFAWRDPARARRGRIDALGVVMLATGLGMLVFGIMQGPEWGWLQPSIIGTLACGAAMMAMFVLVELRREVPLIEIDLLADSTIRLCNLVIFTGQYAKTVQFVMGSLFLQQVLSLSAYQAGLALLAAVAPAPLSAILAGRLSDRLGSRLPTLVGLAVVLTGMTWIAIDMGEHPWLLIAPAIMLGLSTSFLFAPVIKSNMNAAPPEKQGQASGVLLTSQMLGATIGLAVSSTILAMSSYRAVFVTMAAFTGVVFVACVIGFERKGRTAA